MPMMATFSFGVPAGRMDPPSFFVPEIPQEAFDGIDGYRFIEFPRLQLFSQWA